MPTSAVFRIFLARWRWITLGVVAGLVGALLHLTLATPQYEASSLLYISAQSAGDNASAAYQGGLLSEQRVKSYTQLLTSDRVAQDAISKKNLPFTVQQLTDRLSASSQPDTVLLQLTARDSDSAQAAAINNAIATSFVDLIGVLERSREAGRPPSVTAEVVQPATAPPDPSTPSTALDLALGLLLGVLVGIGAALIRNAIDTSIKTEATLSDVVGSPSLGTIVRDDSYETSPLAVLSDPGGARAEGVKQLRTGVQYVSFSNTRKVIAVTSAVPAEGKSGIGCNLAIAIANTGRRVLLVEADLRKPVVAKYLNLESSVGLAQLLSGRVTVDLALQKTPIRGLDVVAAGSAPPNPSELLSSDNMREFISHVRDKYDSIIIDTPPLLPVTDAAAVSQVAEGVIFACRYGRTRTRDIRAAVEILRNVESPILGAVLTMVPMRSRGNARYHYYGYGQRQDLAVQVEEEVSTVARHRESSSEVVANTEELRASRSN